MSHVHDLQVYKSLLYRYSLHDPIVSASTIDVTILTV
jgi:hypothetical protein